jgi:hypothetical protein
MHRAQQAVNEAIGPRNKELEALASRLASELESARDEARLSESRARLVAELQQKLATAQKDLSEKTEIANTTEGRNAAVVVRSLHFYQYLSMALGVLGAGLAGLVGYLFVRPVDEPEAERPAPPQTHRIS